jgi:hypothetical protein
MAIAGLLRMVVGCLLYDDGACGCACVSVCGCVLLIHSLRGRRKKRGRQLGGKQLSGISHSRRCWALRGGGRVGCLVVAEGGLLDGTRRNRTGKRNGHRHRRTLSAVGLRLDQCSCLCFCHIQVLHRRAGSGDGRWEECTSGAGSRRKRGRVRTLD